MKSTRMFLGLMAAGLSMAVLTQSCVSDMPFGYGDGEGTLRMQLVVNSDLTRAETDQEYLASKCIVYISGSNGLLYQYSSLGEVPEAIKLKSGHYVAEAWTGDSVTASFDKKFFRGYQPFDIKDQDNTSVVLTCKIANVVVSINHETVQPDLMKDWKITVSNSRGFLEFDESNMESAKGYFMMPDADLAVDENGALVKGEDGWAYYTNLKYRIEGNTIEGKPFVKEGDIASPKFSDGKYVERAHEYRLNLLYDPKYEETGGSFVTIEVLDEEVLIEDQVGLFSRPAIKGTTFDIDRQLQGNAEAFKENIVKVSAFKDIKSILLTSPDYEAFGIDRNGVDLVSAVDFIRQDLADKGLTWDRQYNEQRDLMTSYIKMSPAFLNRLEERAEEYVLHIHVVDGYGKENSADVRIAVGEAAQKEEDPVVLDAVTSLNHLAIRATYATVTGTLSPDAQNPQIRYRKNGSNDAWQTVDITTTRASQTFSVKLTDLEPNNGYEYQAVDGDFTSALQYFNTEEKYVIPFADMETWSGAKNNQYIQFPGNDYTEENQYWDSGNHGSAAMRKSLTVGSNTLHNSGSTSAFLKSQYVGLGGSLGAFAAGNLFMGRFGATVGTSGAMLTFGKPYNGSHPDKMRVYVRYTPGKVDYTKGNCPHTFGSGDLDHGQIYVALATGPIQVNTGNSDTNGVKAGTFMQYDTDPRILGFGEKTWEGESYGSDSSLQMLEIPIEWRAAAKTQKPTTLIIVCSASKYGDYFTGSSNSVMYVDDFELVYE